MMEIQSISLLDHIFLKLLDPSTSPEKALQLLSTSFFKPEVYFDGQKEPILIFLAYARFLMNKQPNGIVKGIWEEIVKKSFKYLRNDVCIYKYFEQFRCNYPPNISSWLVPALKDKFGAWVVKVLEKHSNCPNPYVRLELFRSYLNLGYFFVGGEGRTSICETFMFTVCEVNPYCFYPSDDGYDPMFNICDLDYMLREVYGDISYEKFDMNNLKFVSNVIQLTGVFATRIGDDPTHCEDIRTCINIFDMLSNVSDVFTSQSILKDVLEVVCEITAYLVSRKERAAHLINKFNDILEYRDFLVNKLNLSSEPCYLPRLLLLRQVQGPKQVRQHTLLWADLDLCLNNYDWIVQE